MIILINLGHINWRHELLTHIKSVNCKKQHIIVVGYNRIFCNETSSMIRHYIRRHCTLKYIEIINTNMREIVERIYTIMK